MRHLHRVDLRVQQDVGLHHEIAGAAQHAAELRVLHVAANLVGVLGARFAIDPSQQRLEPAFVRGIDQEVHDLRDAALWLAAVAIHRVSVRFVIAAQHSDRVAHMRRLDELPVEVRGVTPYREIETGRHPLPQLIDVARKATHDLHLLAQRTGARHDAHEGMRHRRDDAVGQRRPRRTPQRTPAQRLDHAGDGDRRRPPDLVAQQKARALGQRGTHADTRLTVPCTQ